MTLIEVGRSWINPELVTKVSLYVGDKGWGIEILLAHGEVRLGYCKAYADAAAELETLLARLQAAE